MFIASKNSSVIRGLEWFMDGVFYPDRSEIANSNNKPDIRDMTSDIP